MFNIKLFKKYITELIINSIFVKNNVFKFNLIFTYFLTSMYLYKAKTMYDNNVENAAAYKPNNLIRDKLIIILIKAAIIVVFATCFVCFTAIYTPPIMLPNALYKLPNNKIGI